MPRQKREKSGTGICHVMQGKESKTCPYDFTSIKKACEDLKAAYPDVNWKEGKLLNRATKKDLEDWIKKQ